MIQLNYRDALPIYEQIVRGVCEQIDAGILRAGDKLPSVRELAGTLAINPNTIQRAYQELERRGRIASVSGKGSFVCEDAQTDNREALFASLDKAVSGLLALGVTREALAAHITQGGDYNA